MSTNFDNFRSMILKIFKTIKDGGKNALPQSLLHELQPFTVYSLETLFMETLTIFKLKTRNNFSLKHLNSLTKILFKRLKYFRCVKSAT